MHDAALGLAALVYDRDQDPDALLRDFAADLKRRGFRAVGLVQHSHTDTDAPQLSAVLVHSGEQIRLYQDLGPGAAGCKLDVGQLLDAGARVARAIEDGADLVIINRFGAQERDGKGLSYLIDRALSAEIPVVIAVSRQRAAVWSSFAGDLGVTLRCDRGALDAWWAALPGRHDNAFQPGRGRVADAMK